MLVQARFTFVPREVDSPLAIPFKEGDHLLFIEIYPKDHHWLKIADAKGKIGYGPVNYIKPVEPVSLDMLLDFVLASVKNARALSPSKDQRNFTMILESIKDKLVASPKFREEQSRTLLEIMKKVQDENRVEVEDGSSVEGAGDNDNYHFGPGTMRRIQSAGSVVSKAQSIRTEPVMGKTMPYPVSRNIFKQNQDLDEEERHKEDPYVYFTPIHSGANSANTTPRFSRKQQGVVSTLSETKIEELASKLVKIVQESTGVDLKKSEIAVHRIMHHLSRQGASEIPETVQSVLKLLEESPSSQNSSHVLHPIGSKSNKVREIVSFLVAQARSSHSKESESVLMSKLSQLSKEVEDMVGSQVRVSFTPQVLHDLIIYYQTENRERLKLKTVEIFTMISVLDEGSRSIMLKSVLLIFLSKELMDGMDYPEKLSKIAVAMTSLFSSGELLPSTHFDHLGSRFIQFILNYLELPQDEELREQKGNLFKLLLSYNLQFTPREENVLMKVLAERGQGQGLRYFVQSLISLFEDGRDPIANPTHHSVFKVMKDMFSSRKTAEHFQKAEMKWIIDVMYGVIANSSEPGGRRTEFLDLLWLVWRNRSFDYRRREMKDALITILLEDDPLAISDQKIVKAISREFPTIFSKLGRAGSAASRSGLLANMDRSVPNFVI